MQQWGRALTLRVAMIGQSFTAHAYADRVSRRASRYGGRYEDTPAAASKDAAKHKAEGLWLRLTSRPPRRHPSEHLSVQYVRASRAPSHPTAAPSAPSPPLFLDDDTTAPANPHRHALLDPDTLPTASIHYISCLPWRRTSHPPRWRPQTLHRLFRQPLQQSLRGPPHPRMHP